MVELFLLGGIVGLLSGFFGIGGGTVSVPLLLMLGYDIKTAIGISVVQMVFSSVYGSYVNNKKGTLDKKLVLFIGSGGFFGALLSGYVAEILTPKMLEMLFLSFVVFALIRVFFSPKQQPQKEFPNKFLLLLIGFFIGCLSMSVGVGGSLLLVPILVGFLHVELKRAISAGLFFVVFSSVSGVISHTLSSEIDFTKGIILGLVSLFGVHVGIHFKDKIDSTIQKRLLIVFYTSIICYLIFRSFV